MKTKIFYFVFFLIVLIAAVGWAEDPDYPDIPEDANAIATDGTLVLGEIQVEGDEDWFMFTPDANTLYWVRLSGELNMGYKSMEIYQIDELGALHSVISHSVYSNNTSSRTFFLEAGYDVYVRLYNAPGGYSFYFENLGSYPSDGYADDCETASVITVDAEAIEGTLTHYYDGSLEVDWFVFDTEPLHMYQIIMTRIDNSTPSFQIFNEDCEYLLGNSLNRTVTSWFGEQYKIYVSGNASHLGTYYTLEVIDLGLQPDDYPNESDTAEPITADGTIVEGEIGFTSDYHSDLDWFKFTPDANTLYRVTLHGELNMGYKSMEVYQSDIFGSLHNVVSTSVYSSDTVTRTFFLEKGDDIYVRLYNAVGGYSFYFETLGSYPEDGYSDDCEAASAIIVDGGPTEATLTHNKDGSLEVDWFVFDTEPLHMYQIIMTRIDNSAPSFQIFSEDCGHLIGNSTNRTVTSWFGEQYKIYVSGNASHLGTYYTLEVIDLGLYPDDYPNIAADAVTMPKDGTIVEGEIQFVSDYHRDEDWLTFIAGQDGDYDFMFTGELNMGYKSMTVYWEDELGALHNQRNVNVYSNNTSNFTLALQAGKIYVQMYNALGGYALSVISPEPRCGDLDHPYPPGDNNHDCKVDMYDLAVLAANWLTSTEPNSPPAE